MDALSQMSCAHEKVGTAETFFRHRKDEQSPWEFAMTVAIACLRCRLAFKVTGSNRVHEKAMESILILEPIEKPRIIAAEPRSVS